MVSLAELETVFKSDCLGAQTHARHAVIGSIDDLNGGGIRNSQFAQPQRQGSPRLQHGFRDWTEHRMPSEAREVCGSKPVAWREETTIAGIVASSQARAWSYRAGRRRRRVGFGLGSVRVCQLFDFPGLQRLFVLVLVLVFSFSFSLFVFTFLSLSLSLPPSLPHSLSLSLSLPLLKMALQATPWTLVMCSPAVCTCWHLASRGTQTQTLFPWHAYKGAFIRRRRRGFDSLSAAQTLPMACDRRTCWIASWSPAWAQRNRRPKRASGPLRFRILALKFRGFGTVPLPSSNLPTATIASARPLQST